MTKQEAIEAIERFRSLAHGHAVLAEALDMAIEALTHFNSTSNSIKNELNELSCSEKPNESDIIYRQDAIDVIEERLQANGYSNVALVSELNRSIGYIMRLPSAQPERKGEWIWNDEMKCFLCSECERGWREQPTLNGKPLFEWCPVCGADMRGDEK